MGGAGALRSIEGLLSAPLAQPPHTQSFNLQSVPREAKRREAGRLSPLCVVLVTILPPCPIQVASSLQGLLQSQWE